MIAASGYEQAFFTFGIGQGIIVLALAFFINRPAFAIPAAKRQVRVPQTKIDYTPAAGDPHPDLLDHVRDLCHGCRRWPDGGGTDRAHRARLQDRQRAGEPGRLPDGGAGIVIPALFRIFDGFGRPFFGWVSDNIGLVHIMAIAFTIGAISLFTLANYRQGCEPVVFVLFGLPDSGVFGEICTASSPQHRAIRSGEIRDH